MPKDTVFVNGRAVVHQGSSGKGMAFPDVCLCPPSPPAGPIPTPLPNSVMAQDLTAGTVTVKVDGNPGGTKRSFFKKSTGNEVSRPTGGGVMTAAVQGAARFGFGHSFNVQMEGDPVVRHMDPMQHNCLAQPGNTPPAPWMSKMDPALPRKPPKEVVLDLGEGKEWMSVRLVDEKGDPISYATCRVRLANGEEVEVRTLVSGRFQLRGIPKGNCDVKWSDFGETGRRSARRDGRRSRSPLKEVPPDEQETRSSRGDLRKKGIQLATGRCHRVVAPSELQQIQLKLQTSDGDPVPEATFVVTFGDGSQRRGTLDRVGKALVDPLAAGAYAVEYPDQDDVRAKTLAWRAKRALDAGDRQGVLGVFAQPPKAVQAILGAYAKYCRPGERLPDVAKALLGASDLGVVLEYLLVSAGVAPQADGTVVPWREPDVPPSPEKVPERKPDV